MITDAIARHAMSRAADNIAVALGADEGSQIARRTKAFVEAARLTAICGPRGELGPMLAESANPLVSKAAAANTLSGVWAGNGMRELAQSFIASIAPGDLLSQIARYARPIPVGQRNVMIASGFSADTTSEGAPKVVKNVSLSINPDNFKKVASIVVATKELLAKADPAAMELFQRELESAILRGSNQAAIDSLTDSNTTPATATGDALTDLRAGLRAAGASSAYVVAATRANIADLATRVEAASTFGAAGGDFRPGISIVPIDSASPKMLIIPASRLAAYVGAIELRPSGEGSLNMSDSPTSPSAMVNLFQTGCVGVIGERHFNLMGDLSGIVEVS